jgi:hypothetical protein
VTPDEEAFLREMEDLLIERLAILAKTAPGLHLTWLEARDFAKYAIAEAERLFWEIEIHDRDDPHADGTD